MSVAHRFSRAARPVGVVLLGGLLLAVAACSGGNDAPCRTVVVYVSEDQVFSEPILRDFEKATGIRVKAVYDTEETKGTGVMNRLLAEKNNPQADVYWANEPVRAEVLKRRGVAAAREIPDTFKDPDGYWTGFSARARLLVVGASVKDPPSSVAAYTDPRWKGKGVIANPLFGTTAVHAAALFSLWGEDKARRFFRDMKANGIPLSTSNGESADFVARGRYAFSLVDSDDAVNRIRRGDPVRMVVPDQEEGGAGCLLLPNAVVLIRGGPHPEAGRRLVDYLLSREVERKLAFADCAQIPLRPDVPHPGDVPEIGSLRVLDVSLSVVAEKLEEIQPFLKEWVGF